MSEFAIFRNDAEYMLYMAAQNVQDEIMTDLICQGEGFESKEVMPDGFDDCILDGYQFRISDDVFVACFDDSTQTLTINPEYVKEERVLYHELIHLFQHNYRRTVIPFLLHDAITWRLYKKLVQQIPDLDKRVSQYMSMDNIIQIRHEGGDHDLLFFLKSLDVDLFKGWPLYTTFGYGLIGRLEAQSS